MRGLEVDLNSSVIGTNGKAIIGLYAAGELEEASMVTTALTVTRCSIVVFGRVAGKHTAKAKLGAEHGQDEQVHR